MSNETNDVVVQTFSSDALQIKEFLENVLSRMSIGDLSVNLDENDEAITLTIVGEGAANTIGHHGEVLDALQYLCSMQVNGKRGCNKRVVLDAENYRAKREKTLKRLAQSLEDKVKRTGRAVSLEPMNPCERRIIHTTLHNSKYVTTQSEGQGNGRHIVVSPKETSNVLNSPTAPRHTLNFVYRSDKKRR